MTLAESLAVASAKLNKLAGTLSTDAAAPVLKAEEVLAKMAEELKAGPLSKDRSEYFASVLADLRKNNWESTSFISIREVNDPTQMKPKTEAAPTVQSLSTGTPNSQFATNLSKAEKVALIQKLLLDPTPITKGVYADKLDELVMMFGLSESDLEDEYALSWKIGDLLKALYRSAKLETLVGKADSEVTKAALPVEPGRWPLDMASAKYDPTRKSYVEPDPTWGYDKKEG